MIGMAQHRIIGLGVSGLACARELSRLGVPFTGYEKEDRPGGLTRTTTLGPFNFDYGPHVLLNVSPAMRDYFAQLNLDLEECHCSSVVFTSQVKQGLIPAPFQRNLWRLSPAARLRVAIDLVLLPFRGSADRMTYERYARRVCGKTIYDLFVGGYERKRLRYSLNEVDCRWATRLVRPGLRSLVSPRSGPSLPGGNGTDGTFLYPASGRMEDLALAMSKTVLRENVQCNKELVQIKLDSKRIRFRDGEIARYTTLMLSLPLPEIVACISDAPWSIQRAARHLVSTSLYLVRLGVDSPLNTDCGIMRFPDSDVDFYRVSLPSRYRPSSVPEGCDSIMAEIAFHPLRSPMTRDQVRHNCMQGLRKLGIIGAKHRVLVEDIVEIPHAHIIYNMQTIESMASIKDYLAAHSVFLCGKYGQWKDMLIPQSIQSGIDTANGAFRRGD